MDGNAVPLELRSNYLSLSGDNATDTRGQILDRNIAKASIAIAVECPHCGTGKLKDGLTKCLAGDRAGMNGHASHHDGPVNYSDALARLCGGDGALLPCWATTDYNQVVLSCSHFESLLAMSRLPSLSVASHVLPFRPNTNRVKLPALKATQ